MDIVNTASTPGRTKKIWEHKDDVDMPVLDDQKIEELNYTLQKAVRENKVVEVTYYYDRKHHTVKGKITVGDFQIKVSGKKVPFRNIINIKNLF